MIILMATESSYQKKIMKEVEAIGGKSINGLYTKTGEADLQCGYPINGILRYLAIEVKTEVNYNKIMKNVLLNNDGTIFIINKDKLRDGEVLQIHKLNDVINKGGLALLAWNFSQVKDYIEEHGNDTI